MEFSSLPSAMMMRAFTLSLTFLLLHGALGKQTWLTARDNRRYLVEDEQVYNWLAALHYCSSLNLQMVEIFSEVKNIPFVEVLKKEYGSSQNIWLGATDHLNTNPDKNRAFYWMASGNPMNFTYWQLGEPNYHQQEEHCVHTTGANPNFEWNDHRCHNRLHGVACEKHHLTYKFIDIRERKKEAVLDILPNVFDEFDAVQAKQLQKFKALASEAEKLNGGLKPKLQELDNKLEMTVKAELERLTKVMNDKLASAGQTVLDAASKLELTTKRQLEDFSRYSDEVRRYISNKIMEDISDYSARSDAITEMKIPKDEDDEIVEHGTDAVEEGEGVVTGTEATNEVASFVSSPAMDATVNYVLAHRLLATKVE